ncbi:hypothetical protein AT251_13285 [Enterovibrio nigricans]|nr:hypothetical protein AT251_13285 [Enterovibrio nigricans]
MLTKSEPQEKWHTKHKFLWLRVKYCETDYLDIENGKTAAKTTTLMEIAEITKMPIMWFLEDVRDHDDYQSVRDSKDVMDFMMILSKLPESARIELLKNSTQMASMMVSYSNKFANERDVYNPMGLCVVN